MSRVLQPGWIIGSFGPEGVTYHPAVFNNNTTWFCPDLELTSSIEAQAVALDYLNDPVLSNCPDFIRYSPQSY